MAGPAGREVVPAGRRAGRGGPVVEPLGGTDAVDAECQQAWQGSKMNSHRKGGVHFGTCKKMDGLDGHFFFA